ncbi:6321_t:CDS:1 [Scutellospora calospora]|uniref:6321_t:CDS:1 n=1 Tax=Scutellospora calospora TaxID=85575 RepID=A0ACA9K825_9GLOM|nr:6321_t:CDS:1 [Scutellospora calospora]
MNNKNKFIDDNKNIERILLHIATNLHTTKKDDNRVKALSIFKIIENQYWLGYYYQQGYGSLEIDETKAMEYLKKSIHIENYPDAMCRYAIHLIKTSERKEDGKIKDKEIQFEITHLFRKAALLNNNDGCYFYRDIIYNRKLGNEANKLEGFTFINQAAEKGHDKAKLLLEKITRNFNSFTRF